MSGRLVDVIKENRPLSQLQSTVNAGADIWDANRKLLTLLLLDESSKQAADILKGMPKDIDKALAEVTKFHKALLNIYKGTV